MSIIGTLDRLYGWVSVCAFAYLLSSCTTLNRQAAAPRVTDAPVAVSPEVRFQAQQVELAGVTKFVRCGDNCARPTPKTLGAVTPVALRAAPVERSTTPDVAVPMTGQATVQALVQAPKTVQTSVMFERDTTVIGPVGKQRLRAIKPAIEAASVIRIDGRTDDEGLQAPNDKIASARALAVMLFVRDELLAGTARKPELRATGIGRCCYVGDNKTPAGRAANRRVDVTVEPRGNPPARLLEQSADASVPTAKP